MASGQREGGTISSATSPYKERAVVSITITDGHGVATSNTSSPAPSASSSNTAVVAASIRSTTRALADIDHGDHNFADVRVCEPASA